jgi:hypothetical protein
MTLTTNNSNAISNLHILQIITENITSPMLSLVVALQRRLIMRLKIVDCYPPTPTLYFWLMTHE